jgi:hypothetical protein
LFVRHRLKAHELIALELPEIAGSDRAIEIQTLARRQLSPAMTRFIEHMKTVLSRAE